MNPIPDLQFGAALICLQTSTSVIIPKITVTTMLSAITPLVVSSASASRDTQEAEKKAIAKASTWGVTFHRRIRQPSLASLTFARLRDFADKIIWCNFCNVIFRNRRMLSVFWINSEFVAFSSDKRFYNMYVF